MLTLKKEKSDRKINFKTCKHNLRNLTLNNNLKDFEV